MRMKFPALLVVLSFALVPSARAQDQTKHFNLDKSKVALKGYDSISYFTGQKPVQGNERITAEYQGAIYRFATEENKQKFVQSPTKFAPEYGGWCAKAIADKEFVDIDPLNFKITNGRLFLFYKGLFGDALKIWNKDEANLTRRADEQWKGIVAGQ